MPKTLRHLARPRRGFLDHVASTISFYAEFEADVRVSGVTPESLQQQLDRYQSLMALERTLQQQLRSVRETRQLEGATLWTTMLDIYACGRAAARRNPLVQHAIDAFARFMKNGPHKKKATP